MLSKSHWKKVLGAENLTNWAKIIFWTEWACFFGGYMGIPDWGIPEFPTNVVPQLDSQMLKGPWAFWKLEIVCQKSIQQARFLETYNPKREIPNAWRQPTDMLSEICISKNSSQKFLQINPHLLGGISDGNSLSREFLTAMTAVVRQEFWIPCLNGENS